MRHVKCVSYFSPVGLLGIALYALPIQAQPSFTTPDFPGEMYTSGGGKRGPVLDAVLELVHKPQLCN